MRTEFIHLPKAGASICLGYIEPINAIGLSFGFAKNFTVNTVTKLSGPKIQRDGFNRRIGREVSRGRLTKSFRRGQMATDHTFIAPTTDDFKFIQFARELRDLVNNLSVEQITARRDTFIKLIVYIFMHHLGDPSLASIDATRVRLSNAPKDIIPC